MNLSPTFNSMNQALHRNLPILECESLNNFPYKLTNSVRLWHPQFKISALITASATCTVTPNAAWAGCAGSLAGRAAELPKMTRERDLPTVIKELTLQLQQRLETSSFRTKKEKPRKLGLTCCTDTSPPTPHRDDSFRLPWTHSTATGIHGDHGSIKSTGSDRFNWQHGMCTAVCSTV